MRGLGIGLGAVLYLGLGTNSALAQVRPVVAGVSLA